MKNITIVIRNIIFVFVSVMQMQMIQSTEAVPSILGKGIIYTKNKRVIKNMRLAEIKAYWIIYKKDESLHDMMMDEIKRIEFPEAKPEPVALEFENNNVLTKKMSVTTQDTVQ
jgi:hypothetical protein